jgi:hypothetical protein
VRFARVEEDALAVVVVPPLRRHGALPSVVVSIGDGELLDLVVTVKAYPAVGMKTGEAVCVAGVTVREPEWVRLFPVPFRDLPEKMQFRKWQRVRVRVRKPRNDPRPESWSPDIASFEVVNDLPAGDWAERRRLVEELPVRTMCEMNRLNKLVPGRDLSAPSLAVIRASEAPTFAVESRPAEDVAAARSKQDQGQLPMFATASERIEVLEHTFYYRYRCMDPDCSGHRQSIVDWEIAQAYRRWRVDYPDDWEDRLRRRWIDDLWAADRDTLLFVGNQHQHPAGFLILGVFWPPNSPLQGQLTLG